jgi:hypothetical protein
LREKLKDLGTMNMSRCIRGYSNVLSKDIIPSELVRDTIYPLVAPRELSVVTSEYVESAVFYMDGSLIEGSAGFAIHRTGVGGFGFKLSSPAGVFSAELSALFMALH